MVSAHIQQHSEQFVMGLFFSSVPNDTTLANLAGRLEAASGMNSRGEFILWAHFEQYPMTWILEQISRVHARIIHLIESSYACGVLFDKQPNGTPIAAVDIELWPSHADPGVELALRSKFGKGVMLDLLQTLDIPLSATLHNAIQRFRYTNRLLQDWGEFAWLLTQTGFGVYIGKDREGVITIYAKTSDQPLMI